MRLLQACHSRSLGHSVHHIQLLVLPTPELHELVQAGLCLLHIPPDVLALQAVCVDLHNIDEGLDPREQVPDRRLVPAARCPVYTCRSRRRRPPLGSLINSPQLQQGLRSCLLRLRAGSDGPCDAYPSGIGGASWIPVSTDESADGVTVSGRTPGACRSQQLAIRFSRAAGVTCNRELQDKPSQLQL